MKLDDQLKEAVTNIKPSFVATADKNGQPNVSPKGSFHVLDENHVVFVDIKSPQTISNLKENPLLSAIGLDVTTRKGWRIWGKVEEILNSGDLFDQFTREYQSIGKKVNYVIKVEVKKAIVF